MINAEDRKMLKTKTREDFELEKPNSLREFLAEELLNQNIEDSQRGQPVRYYSDADIDDLMPKLFQHIENGALRKYSSNEAWAIRQYIVEQILLEPVAGEDEMRLASEMAQPVEKWQSEYFDPIQNFRLILETSGRKDGYIRSAMSTPKWFVLDYGKKRRYGQTEILQFLRKLAMKYTKRDEKGREIVKGRETASYVTRLAQFKKFLESLPEDDVTGRKQAIPFKVPSYPDKFSQPMFDREDIEAIIYKAITEEKPVVALRIALATIYGCRAGEIAQMDSSRINIEDMTVEIPTEKKGQRKPQPIPEELKPLFSVPLTTARLDTVRTQLRRVCKKANVPCPRGKGIHAIRRAVVTALYSIPELKELSIQNFLRWSTRRGQGVMPKYVKIPVETTDRQILEVHPFVKTWIELMPFIEYLPKWAEIGINHAFINKYITPAKSGKE